MPVVRKTDRPQLREDLLFLSFGGIIFLYAFGCQPNDKVGFNGQFGVAEKFRFVYLLRKTDMHIFLKRSGEESP